MQIISPAHALNFVQILRTELTSLLVQGATTAAPRTHMLFNQIEFALIIVEQASSAIL
jgi:hypothetical protein